MLHRLNDELVVTGEVEERSAGPGVRQLDQRVVAQRILKPEQRAEVRRVETKTCSLTSLPCTSHAPQHFPFLW